MCEVPIVVSMDKSKKDDFDSAIMRNYCVGGFYLEIKRKLLSDPKIIVKTAEDSVLDPVSSGSWVSRKAEVRWCLEIAGSEPIRYGCGVQYIPE